MTKAILITGPSGAGKSTTVARFLERAEGEWAHVSQDDIRQLIKAGYASAGDYYENWSEETKNQYAVSVPICTDMIKRYLEYGINVICDLFATPAQFQEWRERLSGIEYDFYVLRPNLKTTLEQNRQRSIGRLKDKKIQTNFEFFADQSSLPAQWIDSTDLSVDDVVDILI